MIEIIEYQPAHAELGYTFGGRTPVLRMRPGAMLGVSTADCFGGRVRTAGGPALPGLRSAAPQPGVAGRSTWSAPNPATPSPCTSSPSPPPGTGECQRRIRHFGALTGTHQTANLQAPLEERVWIYAIDQDTPGPSATRTALVEYSVDLPLVPMIGTIGVAPAGGEVRASVVPDIHGGNLDAPLVRAGATLYLPVNVDGASLASATCTPARARGTLRRRRGDRRPHHPDRRPDQGRQYPRSPVGIRHPT